MKVRHCYSSETFDLSEPRYTKLYGVYGYLVIGEKQIFWIYNSNDELFSDNVTNDFIIL